MKLLLVREVSEIRGDLSQGLGIIGTIAKAEAEVRIFDNNSMYVTFSIKQIIEKIAQFNPDVVGFHVHTHNIFKTGELICAVKATFPHICLIAGGLHAFHEPEEVLDLGVHIVAIEEADLTILPLLRELKNSIKSGSTFQIPPPLSDSLSLVPGLLFRPSTTQEIKNTGRPEFIKNLDDLPFIDYELFNLEDYIHKKSDGHYVTNTLLTQRGCPFTCSFCQGGDEGAFRMTRENSPEYKINYILYLKEKYGHDYFVFFDANFTLSAKRTMAFCEKIIASGLNKEIKFWCETNASLKLDRPMAEALKEAGCCDIAFGIERLTDDAMEQIGKKVKFEIIQDRIQNLSDVGIRVAANALVGFPFDTVETIMREEKLFNMTLDKVDSIMVSVVLPLPGTKLYHQTDKKRWYFSQSYIKWRPPFYHIAYNYNGNAWNANYFNLSEETMGAVRGMRERMHSKSMQKLNNKIVSSLFIFVQIFAKISLFLFQRSPLAERIILAPVHFTYVYLWKFMVSKFYVTR
ncbi:MAG: B12-binding domain-containing radical SAM protein [Magnetococcales bacterium]|nr:B12-binding domain-containing radical SAM protein [Magnetococcales bacterium]